MDESPQSSDASELLPICVIVKFIPARIQQLVSINLLIQLKGAPVGTGPVQAVLREFL